MRFGLDFGTSNSSLAVASNGAVRLLQLDPLAGETMPTILYVRREGEPQVAAPRSTAT